MYLHKRFENSESGLISFCTYSSWQSRKQKTTKENDE